MTQNRPTGDPRINNQMVVTTIYTLVMKEDWAEYYAWYCNRCTTPPLSGSKDVDDFASSKTEMDTRFCRSY